MVVVTADIQRFRSSPSLQCFDDQLFRSVEEYEKYEQASRVIQSHYRKMMKHKRGTNEPRDDDAPIEHELDTIRGVNAAGRGGLDWDDDDDDLMSDRLVFGSKWQQDLYKFMEENETPAARMEGILVVFLIGLSTVIFVIETVPDFEAGQPVFALIEGVCIVLFTMEIILRVICVPHRDGSYALGVYDFFTSVMNLVDIVAVLPWYMSLILLLVTGSAGGVGGVAVIRAVRLVRVFRVFKLGRYNSSATLFKKALERSAQPLSLLMYFMFIGNILFSSAIYYAEKGNDVTRGPEFAFESIPMAMYWCMVTMTTVGYGDMFPVTLAGKLIGVLAMLAGIVVIALPITLIGSNFVEVYRIQQEEEALKAAKQQQNLRASQAAEARKEQSGSEDDFEGEDTEGREDGTLVSPDGVGLVGRTATLGVGGVRLPWDARAPGAGDAAAESAHSLTRGGGGGGGGSGGRGSEGAGDDARLGQLEARLAKIEHLLAKLVEQQAEANAALKANINTGGGPPGKNSK
mmetsp:Transcript_4585/g.15809  ORF Transcript_4585/g.15809 Transcript_4585/m.15809 type:complete len:517 (-) Transcript_4585:454-2004(-)